MSVRELLDQAGALHRSGRYPEAAKAYRAVLEGDPGCARAYLELGDLFRKLENFGAAESSYRQALTIDSGIFEARNNLGNTLRARGMLSEAALNYRAALDLRPGHAATVTNLGLCLTEQGRLSEAETLYRAALASDPSLAQTRSNLLMCLCYSPGISPEDLFREHIRWAKEEETAPGALVGADRVHRPDRPLRIGYVSADLRAHSVSYFAEALLACHDSESFEVAVYSGVPAEDDTTDRLRGYVDLWRTTVGLDDEDLACRIREDGIDILVDLAGHTAGNRLGAFALRAAPVQVTYCGYPATTGMTSIDYRLTDSIADPPGSDALHTERLCRVDPCFLCYRPPVGAPEMQVPPHDGARRHLTFGSFNSLPKINDRVMRVWTRVVNRTPGSRLLLKNRSLSDPAVQEEIRKRFTRAGLGRDRLELIGYLPSRHEHLGLYGRIDLALDTFPYNGTATTCEAMWMGVPTVALAGDRHSSRVGASLLHAAGLGDLVAETEDEFIEIAQRLSSDEDRLRTLRSSLRERLTESPLCDAPRFMKRVEDAYRMMWHGNRRGKGERRTDG